MKYIALDLGSTYTKIAYITDGKICAECQKKTPEKLDSSSDSYEIDASVYYESVYELLATYITPDISGILIATQMHGFVLTDAAFTPITPYISWQDKQGTRYLSEIQKSLGHDCVKPCGVPLKGNLALCSLLARINNGLVIPDGTLFNTLGGYIIGKLTGSHVCHITNAAPTGLANLFTGNWNYQLIEKARLENLQFPTIETDLNPVGFFGNIRVYADMGDQQVCALGANLAPDNTLHINIGTAGLIGYLTKSWASGVFETRPWITKDMYLLTISGLPGGRNLYKINTFLQDLVKKITGEKPTEEQVWKFISEAANTAGASSFDELFAADISQFVPTIMNNIASAYWKAANNMHVNIGSISFSGGCTKKNPALRFALKQAFSAEDNGLTSDIMHGMVVLTKMIGEKTI